MTGRRFAATLATILGQVTAALAENTRFHKFFPRYGTVLSEIRDGVCGSIYALKEDTNAISPTENPYCPEVLDCVLKNTSETIKGDMTSGIIVMGLTPTIPTFLGSSLDETALLSRSRPVLAFLIACSSPTVIPPRPFVYLDPIAGLKAREGNLTPKRLHSWQAAVIVLVEYILVLAAVANVFVMSYLTGLWTINTISCDTIYLPLLWVGTTAPLHLLAMLALSLRVKTVTDETSTKESWGNRLHRWAQNEITPCITHKKLVLDWKPESYPFIIISLVTSLGAVCHLLYGTIAFSSLQFIGKPNAYIHELEQYSVLTVGRLH
jgi:hypothetical protein